VTDIVVYSTAQLLYAPWYAVTAWGTLVMTSYYGTGHQTTFPSIQWQAAFVGTSGEFSSQIIPGLMVTVSTFSAQVWLGVLLPLLLVCPFTILTTCPKHWVKQDVRRGAVNGEVYLYENSTLAGHAAFLLCVKYIIFFALRVSSSI
jgi:phosphatidylinositol glycan class O